MIWTGLLLSLFSQHVQEWKQFIYIKKEYHGNTDWECYVKVRWHAIAI